jgi:hypothetical protein
VAEGGIDNRLDHLGRRIGLANPFEPGIGLNAHEHRILATGSLRRHIFDSQNLANHTFDAHV